MRIESGETIVVETEDAFSRQIRSPSDRRDKPAMPFSNPQTGPIWIEGAEPGDALAIKSNRSPPLLGHCVTRTGDAGSLAQWLGERLSARHALCPIRDGEIHWSDELTIPYAPMLGCIGTAPAWGVPTTLPAGRHGGNMDIVEVCPGNTVLAGGIRCRRIPLSGRLRTRRWGTENCRPAAWKWRPRA